MSSKRPTASSWDSDDELLNEDSAGIYAFPTEKDEELDEDALLASDEEQEEETMTHRDGYVEAEPALEIMADGDDLLDEDEPFDDISQPEHADTGYHDDTAQHDAYLDDTQHHYEQEEATFSTEDLDQSMLTLDATGYSQHNTSQEADTTVPDTDSESEGDEDDKARGRFKSERSDIISLGTGRSRTDIPDTLEITKEEEEKISKFLVNKNDNRPGQRSGRGRGQPGNRRNKRSHQRTNHHQNFQQRGPHNQFRPRGPHMNMRQQFPTRPPQLMVRANTPFSLLANQPAMMFPNLNQTQFQAHNMPGHNIIGAPIMQQPLVNQQLQQRGIMGIPGQVPVLSTPQLIPDQKIHVNPHFQMPTSRPGEIRPAWEAPRSQGGPQQRGPSPRGTLNPGPRGPMPGPQHYHPRGPSQRPDLNVQQRQFQVPRTSQPWGQHFPGETLVSTQQFSSSTMRPGFSQEPRVRQVFNQVQEVAQPPQRQQRPYGESNQGRPYDEPNQGRPFNEPNQGRSFNESSQGRPFNEPNQGRPFNEPNQGRLFNEPNQGQPFGEPVQRLLQDQDERIPPPFISRQPHTGTQQLPPQATVQPMRPQGQEFCRNAPNIPVFGTVGEQLQHGFQPKIYPHSEQGQFPHMVERESEGQPIQTLVNKRGLGQGQGQLQAPTSQVLGPRPRGPRPGLAGPRAAGPRAAGPRAAGPRAAGPRSIAPRGPQPGPATPRGTQQDKIRPQTPGLIVPLLQQQPQPPPKLSPTPAELEDLEKKRRRAERFSKPAPVTAEVKKKLTLGKRALSEVLGPSPPKVIKTIKTPVVRAVAPLMHVETQSTASESQTLDDDYDEEERRKIENQKQLAELIKARKEKNRTEAAAKLSQKRAIKKILGPVVLPSASQLPTQQEDQPTGAQPQPGPPTQVIPQGALNNVPVGGVARHTDGQWWRKVRVRDAKTGAIKTKFIKVSAEEAQTIQANGPNVRAGQGRGQGVLSRGRGQGRGQGRGRGGQKVGRGQPISPIESLPRPRAQPDPSPRVVNIPLVLTEPHQGNRVVNKPTTPSIGGQQNTGFNLQPITLPGSQPGKRAKERRLVKRPGQGLQNNAHQPKRLVQPQRSINFNQSAAMEGVSMPSEEEAGDKQRRVVLNGGGDAPAIVTDTVLLSGISTGTNETSIRQLAQKVGAVAGCRIDRNNRQAILQFQSTQHAGLFAQRFNRTMLNLTMISVSLMDPR